MSVVWVKLPLRTRLWRRLRYPGIRFYPWRQECTDADCGCCLPHGSEPA